MCVKLKEKVCACYRATAWTAAVSAGFLKPLPCFILVHVCENHTGCSPASLSAVLEESGDTEYTIRRHLISFAFLELDSHSRVQSIFVWLHSRCLLIETILGRQG